MSSFFKAWKTFWSILGGTEYKPVVSEELDQLDDDSGNTLKMSNDRRPESNKDAFSNGAIYTLLLLQREGRMIDFLKEDISSFGDAEIGAAVRQIHAGSSKVLDDVFSLRSVIDSVEGHTVSVDADYDPSTITLIGERPEIAPYKGLLQHKGWIAGQVNLPERIGKINKNIVCPAEVSF